MSNPIQLPVPSIIESVDDHRHSRLHQQGWINLRRKPLFALLTLCLVGYLASTRSWLHPICRLTRKTLQDGMLALLVLPVLAWIAG